MLFIDEDERQYVYVVKGVAIFLMLWGHAIQFGMTGSSLDFYENSAFQVIYSFHMPLFMLISGYLFFYSFQKRDLAELIVHRTKPLLHTIVCFSIFYYYATIGFANVLQGNYGVLFDGQWLNYFGHLWFLWSILTASVLVAVICKKVQSLRKQLILLVVCSSFVLLFPNATMNLYMYPYFVVGFFYARYQNHVSVSFQRVKYVVAFLFPFAVSCFEKKHYIYTTGLIGTHYAIAEYLAIDLYRWFIGFTGSVFVLVVMELIYANLRKNKLCALVLRCLGKMGQYSLQIYAFSTVFLSIYLPSVLIRLPGVVNVWTQNEEVYTYFVTFGIAVFYAVSLTIMCGFLDKKKLGKLLFGR